MQSPEKADESDNLPKSELSKDSDSSSVESSTETFQSFELDDKYVVKKLVAVGNMGRVYEGETKLVKRRIAIKILHSEFVDNPEMLLRFKLEAEIASSLNHPNIVNVFGSGVTAAGEPYIAMDFVDGHSLEAVLKDGSKIDTTRCADIFLQLARAMEYTHEKGVIHRDIKPSNVMLHNEPGNKYLVKLLDFGIAKSTSVEATVARELTLPGTVFGSVLYMSPEQILGKKVNFDSDIYSFGCLLFHALTGKPPYQSNNAIDCMQMHVKEAIPNVAEYLANDQNAKQWSDVVSTCMQKDPSQRFESTQSLRAAIEKISESVTIQRAITESTEALAIPGTSEKRPSKNDMLAAGSVLLIAGVLFVIPMLININLAKAANPPVKKETSNPESTAAERSDAEKKVDALIDQVDDAISADRINEAEKLGRKAYLMSLTLPPDDPRIADCLLLLGKIFEMEQNYPGANQAYNWVLTYNKSKYGPMAPQTVSVLARIKALQPLLNKTAPASEPENGSSSMNLPVEPATPAPGTPSSAPKQSD